MVLANVVGHPRAAQARADPAPVERLFGRHRSHVLEAPGEDDVAREEPVRLVGVFPDALDEAAAAVGEVRGHVLGQAPDADVGDREPRAAARFEQVVDLLPHPEEIEERRDRAQVHDVGPDADEVVHDPRELGEDHPHRFRPGRGVDPHELLHRQGPAVAVHEGGAVVQPVGVGDDLPVGPDLRHLLEVPMHVADLGRGVDDGLPVHEGLDAEGPVHGGVRGADVHHEVLGTFRHLQQPGLRVGQHVALGGRIVLAHRMAHEVVVSQDAREVRVALEDDAVEVPGLPLEPVGAPVHAGERRQPRVRLGDADLQAGVVLAGDRVHVQDHLEPVALHPVQVAHQSGRGHHRRRRQRGTPRVGVGQSGALHVDRRAVVVEAVGRSSSSR